MLNKFPVITFLITACLFTVNCSENKDTELTSASGNKASLEKLAKSYRELTDKIGTSPQGLKPEGKRKFVEQVFMDAGFDYKTTLLTISSEELDATKQYNRDLAELVLLPQTNLAIDKLSTIYSPEEEKSIKQLLRKLNQAR